MKSKLVIFDFADTIASLRPSKEEVLQNFILKEIDVLVPIQRIHEVYHYATNLIFYSSVDIKDFKRKEEFYSEFNNNILSLLGLLHQVDSSKLYKYFTEHGQHWALKNEVKELLLELKSKDCFISLVSNFDTRLYDFLDKMEITSCFDSILVSQEVGLEKPNIKFLELPLRKHNIKSEDAFYIGDSYHLDYIPGIKLNINTYLLDEKGFYPTLHRRVSSLEEFKKIIIKEIENV